MHFDTSEMIYHMNDNLKRDKPKLKLDSRMAKKKTFTCIHLQGEA